MPKSPVERLDGGRSWRKRGRVGVWGRRTEEFSSKLHTLSHTDRDVSLLKIPGMGSLSLQWSFGGSATSWFSLTKPEWVVKP